MSMEKKRMFAIFIIATFLLSTIAFVITGLTGNNIFSQQQEPKVLDRYVLDEDVDPATEQEYVNRGYTFLKFYYTSSPPAFVDALPEALKAGNDIQLFVVKLSDSRERAMIINVNNYYEFTNLTEDNVVNELCNRLMIVPVECSLRNV